MNPLLKRFALTATSVGVGIAGLAFFLRASRPPEATDTHLHSSQFDHSNCARLLWGKQLPTLTLTDQNGAAINLKAHSGSPHSLVLVRYLGCSCSHCIEQLIALNKRADTLKQLGVRVIAFSEDDPEQNALVMKKYGFNSDVFTLASDPENRMGKRLNMNFKEPNGEETNLHGAIVVRRDTVMFAVMDTKPFMAIDSLVKESQRTTPIKAVATILP
ncbi:MAG: redoxin domain-containing protein [Ignavibacteria bacterium]|nr:redoxin domain-containing protein [Ignavibacteria bacterium]